MALLKKNPVFFALVLAFLLVFSGGIYLTMSAASAKAEAKQGAASARSKLESLLNSDPAPTQANLEAAQANVRALEQKLGNIRSELEQGANISATDDPVQLVASIQSYISAMRNKARNSEPPVKLKEDLGFGFKSYLTEATPPPEQYVSRIDKQRQILSYLVNRLIESKPSGIMAVRRNVVETDPEQASKQTSHFKISPAVSAEVPGAVETMAFRLRFTGLTSTLRGFLNKLAEFQFPIVVRSVEVDRPQGTTAEAGSGSDGQSGDEAAFLALFENGGGQNGGGEAEQEGGDEGQETADREPVIENNVSEFTVTVEFIEIVTSETESP